jgi:3'-phosphoadenosine 5'-phosphosulfate sulfotransferase (PAPS reductase)/FAD synthetase
MDEHNARSVSDMTDDTRPRRVVAWFSCGIPSAVAARLAIARYGPEVIVARIDTGSEHDDQDRFQADIEQWMNHPVTLLRSADFFSTWEVWEKRRFIVGVQGAPCTVELKRKVRYAFQQPTDLHVFGYTLEEADRLARFRESEPGLDIWAPLIDEGLTMEDCHALIERAGIEAPAMYRLGFRNNNCIGCPKGGIGYWNHTRRHFPETFDRMAVLERDIGHAVLSEEIPDSGRQKRPVWLDELDPDRGDILTEPTHQCSLMCASVEAGLDAA